METNGSDYEPMETNGLRTGILSDGTRVNVYRYEGGPGNEWTAALHYPDGGYSALTMIGKTTKFDEHNLEGPHMGRFITWPAVPARIRRDIEHYAVVSHMSVNAKKKTVGPTHSDVRSPTRTEVRSPTRTSTKAYTRGNFTSTVTGGAGAGETKVTINLPGGGYVGNGRATTVDPVAAHELDLYIANTYELVGAPNSIGKAIDANLKRKLASGKYDPALAPKAWQHLVDEGAKRYEREFGSDSPIFSAATRRQVAADFARAWEDENGMRANGVANETNLRQAIVDALHLRSRKHLEIWRTVSQRYPSTVYADFDALMGKMEMDGTITLTGSRGPNTYKLA